MIGDTSRFDDDVAAIVKVRSNKFFIAGNSCKLCDGTDGIAWYFTIDNNGNVVNQPTIYGIGPKNKFTDAFATSDGGVILTGATSMIDSVYTTIPSPLRSEDI